MKRTNRARRAGRGTADASQGLRDSAQKIWLAGLGALERARTDGPRAFESLVEQGRNMGARAVGMADEALKSMRQGDYAARRRTLEQAFEERVAKPLGKLGGLTQKDVEKLSKQVQGLSESMLSFMSRVAAAAEGPGGAASAPTRKRRAPSAPAKAARRRRTAKAAATAKGSAGPRARKAVTKSGTKAGSARGGARKARRTSRGPRPNA